MGTTIIDKRYPIDLDDTEWMLIEPSVRQKPGRGHKRTIPTRKVVNALSYLDRTGC
jgi:transposase